MATVQHYRLTQDTAALRLTPSGSHCITKLQVGSIVAIHDEHADVAPEMITIESDGGNYALFACDFMDRVEPVDDDE